MYKINIYNKNRKVVESQYFKIDKNIAEYLSFSQSNNLYNKESSVIFYEAFLDKAYKVNNDTASVYLEYDKGLLSVSDKELNSHSDLGEFVKYCQDRGAIYAHINNFEYNGKMFSKYRIKEQSFINIANLNTNKSKSYTSVYDDLIMNKEVKLSTYTPIASDESQMFFTLSVDALEEFYPSYKKDKKFSGIDLYDNDLIISLR